MALRARRPGSGAVARAAVVVSLLAGAAALGSLPSTSAAFTASTANPASAFAAAGSWCTSPGSATVSMAWDTMVNESAPTANYESATTVNVRARTGDRRRVFVRWSLPSLPTACRVTDATLTFSVSAFSAGRTIEVANVASSWSVSTINWNNQPGRTGTVTTAPSSNASFAIDVTDQVQTLYDVGNNGLTLRDADELTSSTFTQTFRTLNSGSAPSVTISWG